MAPSAPPAPTSVCSSSMKRMTFLARRTSFITALMRSSNWPRYLVPATIIAKSSTTSRRSCSRSGTSWPIIFWAKTFDDGRLSHAGLAQQYWVVLGAAAQDLDQALDFIGSANDGVQARRCGPARSDLGRSCRAPGSCSCHVAGLRPGSPPPGLARRGPAGSAGSAAFFALDACSQQVEHFFTNFFELEAEIHQHLCRDAVVLAQAGPGAGARCRHSYG